ncbi:cysteine hydrolase family protein [Bacillus marinisedimentorum]|uniref:cysteine hydrolase family protein n=1 Tax=Bacillus marinisedimentorum TaxID=1821260 RepID=UPI0008728383|nr:isochorismatase family cysteine hydrolase [Bacillus marinisedimentorum]
MEKALIVVDYTYDFIAEDGKLTCGDSGRAIESEIAGLIREFEKKGELIVFANDIHYEGDSYHPETNLFPPHNIAGTRGRELYGSVKDVYDGIKNDDHVIAFDKTRYSAFAGTELDIKLRERGIKEIHLAGVCTDICVLHTAVDGYNKGYSMAIYEKAVATFNEAGHKWALDHFVNTLGARVI